MKQNKTYTCFISSAGDCYEERQIVKQALNDISDKYSGLTGVTIKPFTWEEDVLNEFGADGQTLIDNAADKADYDIFLGIMRYRFGTPTHSSGSGTEHEFKKALEKKKENLDTKVTFFFYGGQMNPEDFDQNQFSKVKEFKSSIQSKGLYSDYDSIANFEKTIKSKLELLYKELYEPQISTENSISQYELIHQVLSDELENALTCYNEKLSTWVEPVVTKDTEIDQNPEKSYESRIEIIDLINSEENIIIKSPPEFGLTCLAHYIKLKAFEKGENFAFVCAKKTRKHKAIRDVKNYIKEILKTETEKIDSILVDSVQFETTGMLKLLKNLSEEFPNIRFIVFNTIENNLFAASGEDKEEVKINREFSRYNLLALRKSALRQFIVDYSNKKQIGVDEDKAVDKISKDLAVLNMHRTPKNCLSILKASSKIGHEYNAVNRTKLLDVILAIIFEEYEIPSYHDEKPDIKDTTFLLGAFCELLIRRNNFEFSKDFFVTELNTIKSDNFIEIDNHFLFGALFDNGILSKKTDDFFFSHAYWIFYFAAHRMNINEKFRETVFEEKRYIDFPEIIEFYTGIDRNKKDAVEILMGDFEKTLLSVKSKVKIDTLNPFENIKWTPDVKELQKEEKKISENVLSSGLPSEVKDKHNDLTYNQKKPYSQVINNVLKDYSFKTLMTQIEAGSRALRNSDYVDADIKVKFLDLIIEGWNEISKLLIILTPILADRGRASYDGASFHLLEDTINYKSPEEKRLAVLTAVPLNIVNFYKDDLFSKKMGPLIINKAKTESNSMLKHELMRLLVSERPKNWNKELDNYIVGLNKNSFFLKDITSSLNTQFDYNATEISERRQIEQLLSKSRAKHFLQQDNPNAGHLKRARKGGNSKFH